MGESMASGLPARVLGVVARSQDYARGLWQGIAEPIRFLSSLSALLSNAFSSLAGAISNLFRIGGFLARISLPMFSPIPLLPAWLERGRRTQEPEAQEELTRYNVSFLVRISATRKLAADVARRTHANAPRLVLSPLPVAVAREIGTEPLGPPAEEDRAGYPPRASAPKKRAALAPRRPPGRVTRTPWPLFVPAMAAAVPLAMPAARAAGFVPEIANPFGGRLVVPQTRPTRAQTRRTGAAGRLRKVGSSTFPQRAPTAADSSSPGIVRGPKRRLEASPPPSLRTTSLTDRVRQPAQSLLLDAYQTTPTGREPLRRELAASLRHKAQARFEATQLLPLSAMAHIEAGTAESLGCISLASGVETSVLASALDATLSAFLGTFAHTPLSEIVPALTLAAYSFAAKAPTEHSAFATAMATIGAHAIGNVRQALRSLAGSTLLAAPPGMGISPVYGPLASPLRTMVLGETPTPGTAEPPPTSSWKRTPPSARPSLRTVRPESPRTLNVTLLSAEAHEEDLRELERKISRILSDQLRRHYGTTRLQEAP